MKRNKKGLLYELKVNHNLYLMILPGLLGFIIFCYLPMYFILIGFKDYDIILGFMDSPWVGFKQFISFFNDIYFFRILKNTLLLGFYQLLFGFWPPIVFALLLNEMANQKVKKLYQTVSYLPHFIATVVIVGILMDFFSPTGLINRTMETLGMQKAAFFGDPKYFRPMYVGSNIWQQIGYGSILYLAAISGIDVQLYEASIIDGANRFQRIWNITLPGILPTITVLLVLNSAHIINVGFEKVYLMQNPGIYETADVIQTYVYRRGVIDKNFSFATAVGLFNNILSLFIIFISNKVSSALKQNSLW